MKNFIVVKTIAKIIKEPLIIFYYLALSASIIDQFH